MNEWMNSLNTSIKLCKWICKYAIIITVNAGA